MIRHIVLLRLNDSATAAQVEDIRTQLLALPGTGRIAYAMGSDLGLRGDNMDVAIVADFEDVDAYFAYDRHPEHDRIRRDLIAPIVSHVERCQFETMGDP